VYVSWPAPDVLYETLKLCAPCVGSVKFVSFNEVKFAEFGVIVILMGTFPVLFITIIHIWPVEFGMTEEEHESGDAVHVVFSCTPIVTNTLSLPASLVMLIVPLYVPVEKFPGAVALTRMTCEPLPGNDDIKDCENTNVKLLHASPLAQVMFMDDTMSLPVELTVKFPIIKEAPPVIFLAMDVSGTIIVLLLKTVTFIVFAVLFVVESRFVQFIVTLSV